MVTKLLLLLIYFLCLINSLSADFKFEINANLRNPGGTIRINQIIPIYVNKSTVSSMSIIEIPVSLKSNDSDETKVFLFNLAVGEDPIIKVKSFCALHSLATSFCLQLLRHIVESTLMANGIQFDVGFSYSIPVAMNDNDGSDLSLSVPSAESIRSVRLKSITEIANLCSVVESTYCSNVQYDAIQRVWNDAINPSLLEKYIMAYAKYVVDNHNIPFVIDFPDDVQVGIGNVMKSLINFLSIHSNTRVMNYPQYMLGNYSSILHTKHVISSADREKLELQDEPYFQSVFTWDWLIFHEEEKLFSGMTVHQTVNRLIFLRNPLLLTLFTTAVDINSIFDRAMLPNDIVKRLLKGVRAVQFLPHIVKQSYELSDSFVAPTLGVSVRSWQALHETNVDRMYNQSAYEKSMLDIIRNHGIRTLFVAFDNPALLAPQFQAFFESLKNSSGIQIISIDSHGANDILPLEKAAVEMLALSRTTHLLGDARSTFLMASYWFGECRQTVHHPYDNSCLEADC